MWRHSSTNAGATGGGGREESQSSSRSTIGKLRKSLTRRLSLSSRRSSNSSETPTSRAGLGEAFPSLTGSEDPRRHIDEHARGVPPVVFPVPAPPAPRGAPHGEPLSPVSQSEPVSVNAVPPALGHASAPAPGMNPLLHPESVPAPPRTNAPVPVPEATPLLQGVLASPLTSSSGMTPSVLGGSGMASSGFTSSGVTPSGITPHGMTAGGITSGGAVSSGVTQAGGSARLTPTIVTTSSALRSNSLRDSFITPVNVRSGGLGATSAGSTGRHVSTGGSIISTVDALRAERQAAERAAAAARVEALETAKSAARAATEAAESAERAAAAASAASAATASAAAGAHSRDSDSGSVFGSGGGGGGLAEEEDSGFGPLPDLDFADRVWRARPPGETRILARVEMSAMSSASSQSHGRDYSSDRSRSSGAATRAAREYGAGTRAAEGGISVRMGEGASGGAMGRMKDPEEDSERRSRTREGGSSSGRRSSGASSNSSSGSRQRRRGSKKYSRRHSTGEDRAMDAPERVTPPGVESPSVFVSQSSILGTPTRTRSGRTLVTAPRSAGRKANQRPRVKKAGKLVQRNFSITLLPAALLPSGTRPRDSMGLTPFATRPTEEGQEAGTEPPGPPRRRWQRWKGNNKFFWNGRVMLGVHYRQLITSTTLLFSTWLVFFIFILPEYGDWYYLLIAICLLVGSFVSLVYSSVLDPGIIPRRFPDTVPAEMRDQLSYCITCHIVRPPRTKHCKHCNNCVLAFDHHCPWTGNCVGARNYRAFMAFIILVTLSSGFVCTLSVLHTLTRTAHVGPEGLTDAFHVPGSRFVSPPLGLWTAMITALVGALLAFHAYLLGKGQTTNEYLRGEKRRGGIPHGSFFPNCRQLWCGTQPPSLLPDMTDFPSPEDCPQDVNYAVNAYAEIYDIVHPSGDLV